MRVLLQADVKGTGRKGQILEVKEGYARNFLLPRGLAVPATDSEVRRVRDRQEAEVRRKAREEEAAREEARKVQGARVVLRRRTGDGEHLFGSVTAAEVAEALRAAGHPVDRKAVALSEPLRRLGSHAVRIRLHPRVSAEITVVIEPEA